MLTNALRVFVSISLKTFRKDPNFITLVGEAAHTVIGMSHENRGLKVERVRARLVANLIGPFRGVGHPQLNVGNRNNNESISAIIKMTPSVVGF